MTLLTCSHFGSVGAHLIEALVDLTQALVHFKCGVLPKKEEERSTVCERAARNVG